MTAHLIQKAFYRCAAPVCAALFLCACAAGLPSQEEAHLRAQSVQETAAPRGNEESKPGVIQAPAASGAEQNLRAVALSRSAGELWLLAGGELSGVTEDGLDLEGIEPETISAGSITQPNAEAILAAMPQLCLVSEDIPAQKELEPLLSQAGVEVVPVEVNSTADYAAAMLAFTQRTGREDLYRQNVTAVLDGIEAVKERVPDGEHGSFLAIRVSATKNKVLKQDYFACEIISDMHLHNIAGDDSSLDLLSMEGIAAADPDYIFVVMQGEEEKAMQALEESFSSHPVWSQLSAVQHGHVIMLPKDNFQYKPNARWATAYEYVYNIVYGDEQE